MREWLVGEWTSVKDFNARGSARGARADRRGESVRCGRGDGDDSLDTRIGLDRLRSLRTSMDRWLGGKGMAKKKPAKKKAKKKPAKKKVAKKKPAKKKSSKRKPSAAFMKPMTPSEELAAVVGKADLPRTQVVKKLWSYIKRKKLQDPKERRYIIADDKLKKVFGGKKRVSMFEMTKLVNKHLS